MSHVLGRFVHKCPLSVSILDAETLRVSDRTIGSVASEESVLRLAKVRVLLAALKRLFDLEGQCLWQVRFLHKPSQFA